MTAPLQGRDKSSLIRAELAWHQLTTKKLLLSSLIIKLRHRKQCTASRFVSGHALQQSFSFCHCFSFLLFVAKSRAKWFWSIKFGQIVKEHDRLRNLIARVSRDRTTDLLRDQIPYRKSRLTFSGVRRDRFICFILGWSFHSDYGNHLRAQSILIYISYLKLHFGKRDSLAKLVIF